MPGKQPTWNQDNQEQSPRREDGRALYGAPTGPDGPLWEPAPGEDGATAKDSSGLTPNRPAQGARVVSAAEIFSEDFIGAEGASDFLGLDTEFDHSPASAYGGRELELAPVPALATEPMPASGLGAPSFEAEDEMPMSAEPSSFGGAGLAGAGEFGDEHLYDDDLDVAPRRRSPVGALLVVALALGVGGAAAWYYGPKLMGTGKPAVDVAVRPTPKPAKPEPAAAADALDSGAGEELAGDPGDQGVRPIEDFLQVDGGAGEPADPEGAEEIAAGDGGASADGYEGAEDPLALDDTLPIVPDPSSASGAGVDPLLPVGPVDPMATAVGPAVGPMVGPGVGPAGGPDGPATLDELLAYVNDPDSFVASNDSLVDLVWRGKEVPLEAIAAPNRILTPSVGPVRVEMASLDVFEGRLYALGENKVWLDLDLGRIGLDGKDVVAIVNVDEEVAAENLPPAELAAGRRVRASVPGGVLYGRVRSIRGEEVTLVTDSGARITLEGPQLEPVSEQKSVVLKF